MHSKVPNIALFLNKPSIFHHPVEIATNTNSRGTVLTLNWYYIKLLAQVLLHVWDSLHGGVMKTWVLDY